LLIPTWLEHIESSQEITIAPNSKTTKVTTIKYLRLEEMRSSPAMGHLFNEEETREIHALNVWFNGFFLDTQTTTEIH
jgi:hypothetical protein